MSTGFAAGDVIQITGQPYVGIHGKVVSYYPLHQYGPVVQVFLTEGKDKGKVLTLGPNNVEFISHGDPIPPEDLPKSNSCRIL